VLLLAYADAGLQRWPERPLFVYLTTFARHGPAAFFAMSARERAALEDALEKAVWLTVINARSCESAI
jgi:hypothetical protein